MLKNMSVQVFILVAMSVFGIFYVQNMIFLWLIMEMQMILFCYNIWQNVMNKSSLMLFFLIQIYSSFVIIFCFVFSEFLVCQDFFFNMILFFLLLKMAIFPFHKWGLKFVLSLNYLDLYVFLSVMKLIPLYLFSLFFNNLMAVFFMFGMILTSFYVPVINSYKKLIFLSSVNTTLLSLMIVQFVSLKVGIFFFVTYLFFLYFLMDYLNLFYLEFMFNTKMGDSSLSMFLIIFSLVGIPYSFGFLLKIMWLESGFSMFLYNIIFFFVYFISCFFSFFYLKLLFFNLTLCTYWQKNQFLMASYTNMVFTISFLFLGPILLVSLNALWMF